MVDHLGGRVWLSVTCLAGTVSMTCVSSSNQQQAVPLAVYLAPTLIGGVGILAIALLAFLYWRRLVTSQITNSCGTSAGTALLLGHTTSQVVNLPNLVL